MAPYGDHAIDDETLDEIARLLGALFTGAQRQVTGARWREPEASSQNPALSDAFAPETLSVGDLASSFDNNG